MPFQEIKILIILGSTWLLFFSFSAEALNTKSIPFESIPKLIEKNKRLRSSQLAQEGEEKKRGHLLRSFLPELKAYGGKEEFQSERLGRASSSFYGVEAEINLFSGMHDYWENQKRTFSAQQARLRSELTRKDLIFEAQKFYLSIAKQKKTLHALDQAIKQLKVVYRKTLRKVKGGIISHSDLTALRLSQALIEEQRQEINRLNLVSCRELGTLLSIPVEPRQIEEKALTTLKHKIDPTRLHEKSLLQEIRSTEVSYLNAEAGIASSERLPSIDIFAAYGLQPYSEREFTQQSERQEWRTGVQATWKIGDLWEKSLEADRRNMKTQSLKQLNQLMNEKTENDLKGLVEKEADLRNSLKEIAEQMKAGKHFTKQVSDEYLKGVKSTADLTSAYIQWLTLDERKLNLHYQLRQTQIEFESLFGHSNAKHLTQRP